MFLQIVVKGDNEQPSQTKVQETIYVCTYICTYNLYYDYVQVGSLTPLAHNFSAVKTTSLYYHKKCTKIRIQARNQPSASHYYCKHVSTLEKMVSLNFKGAQSRKVKSHSVSHWVASSMSLSSTLFDIINSGVSFPIILRSRNIT